MGLSNKHGLTDALLEYRQTKKLNVEYFQSVKDPSFAGTMAVLTSGIHIPNPSELLGSHVFKDYINCVKLLQRNNVNVLGSVLTKAKSISGSHYYYY